MAEDRSIAELRAESVRNREQLAATVGQLRVRVAEVADEIKTTVSPTNVKEQIRERWQDEKESLIESVRQKARDNPLQAAAVGAAVAYPAWSLLRAVPRPLLLIGLGVFLSSNKGKAAFADAKSKLADVAGRAGEALDVNTQTLRNELGERAAEAGETVRSLSKKVSDATTSVVEQVSDQTTMTVASMKGAATNLLDQSVARSPGSGFGEPGATPPGLSSLPSYLNDNALLIAGIGAAAGAILAAAIPSSDAENRLFGPSSDALKGKAGKAVTEGLDRVGEIAAQAAAAVAASAEQDGLDAAGATRAVEDLANRVRSVAEKGLDAALGGDHREPTMERDMP